jgi:hypothetical protein
VWVSDGVLVVRWLLNFFKQLCVSVLGCAFLLLELWPVSSFVSIYGDIAGVLCELISPFWPFHSAWSAWFQSDAFA